MAEHYTYETDSRPNLPTQETSAFMADEDREPSIFEPDIHESDTPTLSWRRKKPDQVRREATPLYIQEIIEPSRFLKQLGRTDENGNELGLFASLKDEEHYEWYQHSGRWYNRLIHGDSAQIMASLAEKEGMVGKVQMVYFDPPYGISFNSNMQVDAAKRSTSTSGSSSQITHEPEMARTFRDTYRRGIHDYLDSIRENVVLARSLLADSGSLFLQIGQKNVHRIAVILDEVFGDDNRMAMITFVKKGASAASGISEVCDYILWYCKDINAAKFHQLYKEETRVEKIRAMSWHRKIELPDGSEATPTKEQANNPDDESLVKKGSKFFIRKALTSQGVSTNERSQPFFWQGEEWLPTPGGQWRVSQEGLHALGVKQRLSPGATKYSLSWKRYESESPGTTIHNVWEDKNQPNDMHYVVETGEKVIQRCMLMSTDPGDLVLDITCGSGTTPAVAEQWGRRWIATDASRIPITLARQRVLSSVNDWYVLKDSKEGVALETNYGTSEEDIAVLSTTAKDPKSGFVYERVPYVSAATLAYDRPKTYTLLVDRPHKEKGTRRIASPFTVESHSPYQSLSSDEYIQQSSEHAKITEANVLEALQVTGINLGDGQGTLSISDLEAVADITRARISHLALGKYEDRDDEVEQLALSILPQDATCSRSWIQQAANQAIQIPDRTTLVVIAFNFSGDSGQAVLQFGRLKVIRVNANRDLQITGLAHSKLDRAFVQITDPDIAIHEEKNNQISVEIIGFDTFDPKTGNIQSGSQKGIACWMVDTNFDGRQFLAHRIHLPDRQADKQVMRLRTRLKREINESEWKAFLSYRTTPFTKPDTGQIAVRIVTNTGIESSLVRDIS